MDISEKLDRHQSRRVDGIPSISVLIGPTGLSINYWRKWSAQKGYQTAIIRDFDISIKTILQSWLTKISENSNLIDICINYLARLIGQPVEQISSEIQRKTHVEWEWFLNHVFLSGGVSNDIERLCKYIIQKKRHTLSMDDLSLIFGDRDVEHLRIIGSLGQILPDNLVPCILIVFENETHHYWLIKQVAGILEKIAVQNILLPLGLAIQPEHYQKFLQDVPESRSKTLLRETVIHVESLKTKQIESILDLPNNMHDLHITRSIQRLATDGANHELIADYKEALKAVSTVTSENITKNENARSAAEQFLFRRLETHPKTSGLFELNGKLDFKFGGRRIEVDLVSKRYLIAIEIDGYYHFLNAQAYRKDRLKDLTLQKHGYIVIRFMAEDVVRRLEEILDTILDIVQCRTLKEIHGGTHGVGKTE